MKRCTEPAFAVGDPALLERVAGNLLENAVRHNVEGGWLEVSTGADPRWTTLRVASSGPAIAPESVNALFEPFRRAGVQRTARNGTGLGLSIVQAATTAHHGKIHATALPAGGLAITIQLPAAP